MKLCESIMENKQVLAVLGLGGFASGPAMKAAAKYGLPVAILNPDALPGRANLFGMKYADRIFLQWQASQRYFGKYAKKCVVSGCPIRKDFSESKEEKSKIFRDWGLAQNKKTLLVVGGSQGGRNVNQAVVELLERAVEDDSIKAILTDWQAVHITGQHDEAWVRGQYELANQNVKVVAFTDQMSRLLPCVDLVVSRAGASTLAELTAVGVASILLPYPYHRDQHQMRNAEVLAEVGAAEIVVDDCDAASIARRLGIKLMECITKTEKLKAMKDSARELAKTKAAYRVAEELKKLAGRG
jgi:UDP-N-acetylglucosamine--N-acetylmuramyl-(pentapeptide) pyrophosphoryl-undecaprenol N-acetylglucosamine transferase